MDIKFPICIKYGMGHKEGIICCDNNFDEKMRTVYIIKVYYHSLSHWGGIWSNFYFHLILLVSNNLLGDTWIVLVLSTTLSISKRKQEIIKKLYIF